MKRVKRLILILFFLVLIFGGTTFYFYKKSTLTKGTAETQALEEEAKALAIKVGILMVLPKNEVPTIATVSDPSVLKDQVFFIDAKKGDKVLIYTGAKKAILYDPTINKIVNVAPLNIGDKINTQISTPSQTETP
jgi:hypothetical protein